MRTFWFFYVLAQTLHVIAKGHLIIHSKNSGIATWRSYFVANWVPLMVRFSLASALFYWWLDDPTLIAKLFDKIGSMLSPGLLQNFITGIGFPLNVGTSFFYGIAADACIDKVIALVPMFKNDIPPIVGATGGEDAVKG